MKVKVPLDLHVAVVAEVVSKAELGLIERNQVSNSETLSPKCKKPQNEVFRSPSIQHSGPSIRKHRVQTIAVPSILKTALQ